MAGDVALAATAKVTCHSGSAESIGLRQVQMFDFVASHSEPAGRAARLYKWLLESSSTEVTRRELESSAVVFSPHPDDETLGCGGTIIRKKKSGASVRLVHMTDGGAGGHPSLITSRQLKAIRLTEARMASHGLGLTERDTYFLEFEDGNLIQQISPAVDRVSELLENEWPEQIFVPYRREPVSQALDHIVTTKVVLRAITRFRRRVTIWEYPIWFWLHWPWISWRQGKPAIIPRLSLFKNTVLSLFGVRALVDLRCSVYVGNVIKEKYSALCQHKSQMERLVDDARWHTLADIYKGQFLGCFCWDREFFRCYELNG